MLSRPSEHKTRGEPRIGRESMAPTSCLFGGGRVNRGTRMNHAMRMLSLLLWFAPLTVLLPTPGLNSKREDIDPCVIVVK
jgi:hypothetical protein